MKQITSFGCGVDSVAGLLLNSNYDEIIFADTGSELPETYAYLDYFEKKSGCYFCMFTPKKKWIELKNNHPDLFQKTLDLEKNAMYTKEGKRKWNLKPLINMRGKESKTLFECACFNG